MPRRRITDANLLFAGGEPHYSRELTKIELINALNWYSQNKDTKFAEKCATDYLKKNHKIDSSSVSKSLTTTFGFVCRIVANGGSLPVRNQVWFDNEIEKIKTAVKSQKKQAVVKEEVKPTVSIQDRIAEKIASIAGDIEGSVDDYVLSGFKDVPSPASFLQENVKGIHANRLIEIFKKRRMQYDEVLHTKDKDLKEGYSCFSKTEIKKLVAYFDQIILDCKKITETAVKTRKPRKRKEKTPAQIVSKVKVCKEFKPLNLVSVDPTAVIGAMQVWVYNTKYRKLGCYHADDAGGLSIKGSSIINFNESKSVQKTVRKPESTVPEVLNGGKVYLRNAIANIRAVESALSGRLNADVVILRVIK